MLKIGIVLVSIGFFIAPIIQSAPVSIPIFLLGFLFVLRSKQIANPANSWAKGAMWGLLGYVLAYTIMMFLNAVYWFLEYYTHLNAYICTYRFLSAFQHLYTYALQPNITYCRNFFPAPIYSKFSWKHHRHYNINTCCNI